ncbi:MAG TPA: diaminopimelate decarboxylase [Atribacteraceae bacterium]|nr:diaminopimelate decarboxylase [Atribacteraceae bacterium]
MLGNKSYNERGCLTIAGCDLATLGQELGTPLYIIDEDWLRQTMREYRSAFARFYPDSTIAYAGKAFLTSALCRILLEEGLWLDTVSGGEFYLAMQSGFSTSRILFHGNNKQEQEIDIVFNEGIGRWVVDSEQELDMLLNEAPRSRKGKLPLFFRITPGIDPHTHEFITTGRVDSKFGLPLVEGIAHRVIERSLQSGLFEIKGLHCHIGSQVASLDPFLKTVDAMVEFMVAFRQATGYIFAELDVGGGLGVPYLDEEEGRFPTIEEYAQAVSVRLRERCRKAGYPLPHLFVEPGRSIVNIAGSTLYRVGTVKRIPGVKTYVAVDGGMTDNPRPILYGARYQAQIVNRFPGDGARESFSIVGKCCESGDVIIPETVMAPIEPGDYLLVEGTGAYNYSMASNYNYLPRPGVVFLSGGVARLVVRPENWYDLIRRDITPEELQVGEQTATE